MIDPSVPIIILHGLGNRAWTLILLEYYLNWHGYSNVYRPQYDADKDPNLAASDVSKLLIEHFKGNKNQSFVVIGNSMGGLVAFSLSQFGWKIELAVTINSPLNGSTMLRNLDSMLPTPLMNLCGGNTPTYNYLKRLAVNGIPPHPYKTIGMNLPFLSHDSMVYETDAVIEREHHHAIGWGSHHTVIIDPRVYFRILAILTQ